MTVCLALDGYRAQPILTLLRCLSLHRVTSPTTTFPQGIRMQFTVVFCAMAAFVSIADGDCVDGYGWACDDGQVGNKVV